MPKSSRQSKTACTRLLDLAAFSGRSLAQDWIEVLRMECEKLSDQRLGELSECIRQRVEYARQRQRTRFLQSESNPLGLTGIDDQILCNAEMRPAEVRQFCQLDDTGRTLMRTAMNQQQLSARAYSHPLSHPTNVAPCL